MNIFYYTGINSLFFSNKDRKANIVDDVNEEQPRQPPNEITKIIMGQTRKYHYLESVKSIEELDKLRFKVITNQKQIKLIVINFFRIFATLSLHNKRSLLRRLLCHAKIKRKKNVTLNCGLYDKI
jgi:hypothetical protein